MSIEVVGLLITAIGVVVAIFAWMFPKHRKSTLRNSETHSTPQNSPPISGEYKSDIEVAITHLETTILDDERMTYLVGLSKRINSIALSDLSRFLSFLARDENRIKSVKVFSGKINRGFSASDYEFFINEFTFSENKQKAARYVYNR